jgi:hypothetical protein
MSFAANGEGALRRGLEDARREMACSVNNLTVSQVETYRLAGAPRCTTSETDAPAPTRAANSKITDFVPELPGTRDR